MLKAYGTWYSQAVTHPSTNQARRCLTSVIRREPVLSTWYGRKHLVAVILTFYSCECSKNPNFSKKINTRVLQSEKYKANHILLSVLSKKCLVMCVFLIFDNTMTVYLLKKIHFMHTSYVLAEFKINPVWTPWRNGSASDSRSEGCVFKSRRGQVTFGVSIKKVSSVRWHISGRNAFYSDS